VLVEKVNNFVTQIPDPFIPKLRSFAHRVVASIAGEIISRSWIEQPILFSLEKWFFPVSRLWAAALVSETDVAGFCQKMDIDVDAREQEKLRHILTELRERKRKANDAEQDWEQAFFGPGHVAGGKLKQVDETRLLHRSALNAMRSKFRFLRNRLKSSVHHKFLTPEQVRSIYPQNEEALERLFDPPLEQPGFEVSRSIDTPQSRTYWIKFKSPFERMDDTVYARVLEPVSVKNPPTLIFGHGIGVDFDHWNALVDFVETLPELGIRVIRPEAAWHGRRVQAGYYAGEGLLSSTPLSFIDFFVAQHQEWSVLCKWARATSSGPLGVGGSSLGAQTAQMFAIRASSWPAEYQPDALLLLTHCSRTAEVALDGKLADIWGLHEPLIDLGWTHELTERWLHRVDPKGDPCMAPERIVSVLGRHDGVTPYLSGLKVQEKWGLPADNRFSWPCGHFGVPLRVVRHRDPLARLTEIFRDIAEDTKA
jgi:pimeloyl-ACP methyl ester carboxylesterase